MELTKEMSQWLREIREREATEWPQFPNRRDWPELQYGLSENQMRRWLIEGSQAVVDRHELLRILAHATNTQPLT